MKKHFSLRVSKIKSSLGKIRSQVNPGVFLLIWIIRARKYRKFCMKLGWIMVRPGNGFNLRNKKLWLYYMMLSMLCYNNVITSRLNWPTTSNIAALTLKMNTAHVVKTLVTIDNSPIQDFTHPDDHIPRTYEVTLLVQLFYHSAFDSTLNYQITQP